MELCSGCLEMCFENMLCTRKRVRLGSVGGSFDVFGLKCIFIFVVIIFVVVSILCEDKRVEYLGQNRFHVVGKDVSKETYQSVIEWFK